MSYTVDDIASNIKLHNTTNSNVDSMLRRIEADEKMTKQTTNAHPLNNDSTRVGGRDKNENVHRSIG